MDYPSNFFKDFITSMSSQVPRTTASTKSLLVFACSKGKCKKHVVAVQTKKVIPIPVPYPVYPKKKKKCCKHKKHKKQKALVVTVHDKCCKKHKKHHCGCGFGGYQYYNYYDYLAPPYFYDYYYDYYG